jgi:hypothetical protein
VSIAETDDPPLVTLHQLVKGRGLAPAATLHQFNVFGGGIERLRHRALGFVRQDTGKGSS